MKFIQQEAPMTCNLVAIKQVHSYFFEFPSSKSVKVLLPNHSFGNFITEIAIYFENLGFHTILYANDLSTIVKNKPFMDSLQEYMKIGKFVDKIPSEEILSKGLPIIVNVDWYKAGRKIGKPDAHYVVVVLENSQTYLYDASNYKRKVERSFQELLDCSTNINRFHHNGMWLAVSK